MIKKLRFRKNRENHTIKLCFSLLVFVFISSPVYSQKNIFLPSNSTRVRALGLAGAVTAVQDNIGSTAFNPGTYVFYSARDGFRFSINLSPFMPVLIARYPNDFFGNIAFDTKDKLYAGLLSLIKSINLNYRSLNIGIILGEPNYLSPESTVNNKFIYNQALYSNHTNTFMLNFQLAEQVAIGAGLHLMYYDEGKNRFHAFATSYGIMMQPKPLFRVGVSIFNLPPELQNSKELYDEVKNEAINIGTAIFLPYKNMLSFDIRNLALGSSVAKEKYLIGFENTLGGQIALRCGMKLVDFSSQPAYTFGIGLFDSNFYHNFRYRLKTNNYLINYAILIDTFDYQKYFIHTFSFTIHL